MCMYVVATSAASPLTESRTAKLEAGCTAAANFGVGSCFRAECPCNAEYSVKLLASIGLEEVPGKHSSPGASRLAVAEFRRFMHRATWERDRHDE